MQTNLSAPNRLAQGGDTLLVYGAGANQVPVINACRGAGWRVVVIDRDQASPGRRLADRFVCLSLREHGRILAATADENLVGVVARITDHVGLNSSLQIARDRGLASACPELFEASTSKVALALHCQRVGVSTPRRYSPDEPIFLEDGPIIIRPDVTTRGKAGIHRIDSIDAMQSALEEARSVSGSGRVDVSEWIDGADVSVLAHLRDGRARRLAMWDEWVAVDGENRIRGVGCGMPSMFQHDQEALASIDGVLNQLAQAFPASDTAIVLSLRVDREGRLWVIEIHLGVGGDGIAEKLLPDALPGFDAFELLARIAAGETPDEFVGEGLPRALLRQEGQEGQERGENGWQLVRDEQAKTLRAKCLTSLPASWEPPVGLLPKRER